MSNPLSDSDECLCTLLDRSCGIVVSIASVVSELSQNVVNSLSSSVSTVVVPLKRTVVSCLTKGVVCWRKKVTCTASGPPPVAMGLVWRYLQEISMC